MEFPVEALAKLKMVEPRTTEKVQDDEAVDDTEDDDSLSHVVCSADFECGAELDTTNPFVTNTCAGADCVSRVPTFRRHCDQCLKKKPLLVLDLDETLVFADLESKLVPGTLMRSGKAFDCFDIGEKYLVYKRPFVDLFLRFAFSLCHVGIWSAGNEVYVKEVVKKLCLPDQIPEFVFWRDHCSGTREHYCKPLKYICECLDNVLHIDDRKNNFVANPNQGIEIESYDDPSEQENDMQLLRMLGVVGKFATDWKRRQIKK